MNAASECACSQVEAPDREELHPTVRPGERGPRYSCAITPNLRAAGLVTGDRVCVRPALVGDAAGASATAALRGVVTERLERRSVLARPVKAPAPARPLNQRGPFPAGHSSASAGFGAGGGGRLGRAFFRGRAALVRRRAALPVILLGPSARVALRALNETRPVSTGGGTRRVQIVREGGGGGDLPP